MQSNRLNIEGNTSGEGSKTHKDRGEVLRSRFAHELRRADVSLCQSNSESKPSTSNPKYHEVCTRLFL